MMMMMMIVSPRLSCERGSRLAKLRQGEMRCVCVGQRDGAVLNSGFDSVFSRGQELGSGRLGRLGKKLGSILCGCG